MNYTFMTAMAGAYGAFAMAQGEGIRLEVNPKTLRITASPRSEMSEELLAAVKENHDDLVKIHLFRQALEYLTGSAREAGPQEAMDVSTYSFETFVGQELAAAFEEESVEEYRKILRRGLSDAVRAGKAAGRKVKAAKAKAKLAEGWEDAPIQEGDSASSEDAESPYELLPEEVS